jgi:hypothetical protein
VRSVFGGSREEGKRVYVGVGVAFEIKLWKMFMRCHCAFE